MSPSSDTELEKQLLEAGNSLADPPSSDDQLLRLLDQVYNRLLRVDQQPTKSMVNALSPLLRALVANRLLHHPNSDVKVAVASCISEITRITAPNPPYEDGQMKEVFQLIVSSFENLSDRTSRSYAKRISILQTVSTVSSCLVMLDLKCEMLIVDMFKHFLKGIRDYHPDNVFSSMETIMTVVLEESDDISKEFLSSPILASLKNDNKEILPIARMLGERVLKNCAAKVKPYLIQAVQSLSISVYDYSPVVASICEQEKLSSVEQSDLHATPDQMGEENRLEWTSSEDATQVDGEVDTGETSTRNADPATEKSSNSVVSNEITQMGEEEPFLHSNSKKHEDEHLADQLKSTSSISNADLDNMDTEKAFESESRKEVRPVKNTMPPADVISKQASEAASDSEVKPTECSGKEPSSGISNEDKNAPVVASKNKSGTARDSEVNEAKECAKKVEVSGDDGDGSLKHLNDKEKWGHTEVIVENDLTKLSAKDDNKDTVSSPKSKTKSTKDGIHFEMTLRTKSKRKHTPVGEKQSGDNCGEDLVGSKIKVWWPKDRMFYEGVVDYYDSVKKKHKVLYTDGVEEILNLNRQKWLLVGFGSESDKGEEAEESSFNAPSDVPQKKKARTNLDLSAKQGKLGAASGRGASSGKSKSCSTKPGKKSRNVGGADGKTKSEVLKKSNYGKSKVGTPKDDNGATRRSPKSVKGKMTGSSKTGRKRRRGGRSLKDILAS